MGYQYDAAGNQKTTLVGANQAALNWDAEGELASITGTTAAGTNLHDADGNRIIKTGTGGATVYLPSGMEINVTTAGAVTASRWYTFNGTTIAVRNAIGPAGSNSVITDHQGSPVGQVASGNWAAGVTRTRTDPFGSSRGSSTLVSGHGFLAAPVDTTGFVALGARYYDPAAGRFISVDPLLDPTYPAQFDAYGYSANNPITWSDPSGLSHRLMRQRDMGGGYAGKPQAPNPGGFRPRLHPRS